MKILAVLNIFIWAVYGTFTLTKKEISKLDYALTWAVLMVNIFVSAIIL